ncbi:hypothetical protein Dvina_20540 [Dactylosporangium vinaceum]|uniref:Uncharacterized protein n=1 Tax=Dactylosporangium vinaceum TaxID=53362 RepID=A0ABV5MS55_9ACTN|nr:hypothetical protein Dvina_20540 [Dactylosporangium vinaceum]
MFAGTLRGVWGRLDGQVLSKSRWGHHDAVTTSPVGRDRYLDVLRDVAIVRVVVFHMLRSCG